MTARAGYADMVFCTLVWASIGVIVRQITLPASTLAFFRMALGFLVVLAWMRARDRWHDLRPRGDAPLLIGAGAVLAVHWLLLFVGYQRIGVVTTILVVFVGPVLWTAAAPLVLGERLRLGSIVALAVAFGGIALISVPRIERLDALGLAAAFGSAILFAVLVLAGKILTTRHEPGAISVWELGVGAVILTPALTGVSLSELARALPLVALLGIVHTGSLNVLFFRAVKRLPAQRLGVLFYLEPAAAVAYAWLFLSEQPAATTIAGGLIVVAAGIAIITTDRAPKAVPIGDH